MPNVTVAGARLATGPLPVPVKGRVCGLPVALSVNVIVPLTVPAAVGEKVTLTVQLAPCATLPLQVLVSANWALAAMELSVRVPVPPLVNVTVWAALVVPIFCAAKVRLAGPKFTAGATPVPVSAKACGLAGTLSLTVRLPVRVPTAVGANITVAEQGLPPEGIVAVQVFVSEKSPLATKLVNESGVVPGLLTVIVPLDD